MERQKYRAHECTIDGYRVLVGKDADSNDHLSLRLAQANDYWFHVKGSPGSHVILCCHDSVEPPDKSTLEQVASLAAYYSSQRNGGKAPVTYTLAKYVKKQKGSAPGQVIVSKDKTLRIRPKAIDED